MQEIHFDESQLNNLHAIAADLFAGDAEDPRSWNYKRQLVRPRIHWVRIFLFAALLVLGIGGSYLLLTALSVSGWMAVGICSVEVVVVLLLFLKRILINLIQIYQRFAPDAIRNKCRFEPSCSCYMILALEKYGLWKGLTKGIDRLKRCNANGGGFDYP